MRIPHEFAWSGLSQGNVLNDEVEPVCHVCTYPQDHVYHLRPDETSARLLGELYDFVVDNVMIGKIHAPPNGLLSRCSKVLSR